MRLCATQNIFIVEDIFLFVSNGSYKSRIASANLDINFKGFDRQKTLFAIHSRIKATSFYFFDREIFARSLESIFAVDVFPCTVKPRNNGR